MTRPKSLLLAALIVVAAALGLRLTQDEAPAEALGPITLQTYASGFTFPVGIAQAGDNRLFIVEKTGRIRIVIDGTTLATPFLNVNSIINSTADEEGLLGLAFHPNYPATPYFFIFYTNTSGNVVIARYAVSANPNIADTASATILLTIPHPTYANHNGGALNFGPDGYLYVAVGDGGGGGDPGNNAQNMNTLLGKILRLNVDQNVNVPPYYGIPASNPFTGAHPALDEIWAYGVRNPWRLTFDSASGDMLFGDVGQDVREEIDFEPNSSLGGLNYGWRIMEGFGCYSNEPPGCFHASLTPPVLDYSQGAGDCSVTGGYVYHGMSASYDGEYIFGDFCSGRIWHATPGAPPWSKIVLLDTAYFISTFGEDAAGELYMADYFGGTIQKLLLEDSDGDTIMDQADNCPSVSNVGQQNMYDINFIDQTPPSTQDDATWVNSDKLGDACDADDDNDGLADTSEATGCNGSGPLDASIRDFDGDRVLDGPECTRGTNPANASSVPASTSCGAMGDADGDGLPTRLEVCNYNSNPASTNTDGDLCSDGREVASINGDATVSSGDQGLLAAEMLRVPPPAKLVNMDLNKDGLLNSGDQGVMASRFGACP